MAEIIPFKGILYNPHKVDTSSVMAPPYDIVTSELKDTLYGRSPYNIIRIDFGKEMRGDTDKENRYTRASRFLSDWLKNKVLLKDTKPSFYCYEITYRIADKKKKIKGIIGAVRIEELNKGKIHPHEMTYSKPKTDRLNILRYCMANTSPIFSLYSSKDRLTSCILRETTKGRASIKAIDGDGFIHKLWRIRGERTIETIKKELSAQHIFIADGHHRYETALEFRNEMYKKGILKTGKEPFNYVMMFLTNMEDNGLTLFPTHRLVKMRKGINIEKLLKPYFDITPEDPQGTTESKMFSIMKKGRNILGMYLKNKKAFYVLKFKDSYSEINSHESLKRLNVTILHKFILERLLRVDKIEYEMNPELAIEKVNKAVYHAVFFLNPTRIEDVKNVALAGERMPPKSTYFYPKLLTGMAIYKF
ncbi:MAG: DUF1015 domain-containing protein [Nitrospirae bacterium]|nr:DUF1015 domain-containing protein [Nitrospirota bacterium]